MKIFSCMTKNKESEKDLEARLVKEVEKRGGICLKLTSQFHRGMPDRLVILPHHTSAFVEVKSSGKAPTGLQLHTHEQLRAMRFTVRVIDSTEKLDEFFEMIDNRLAEQTRRAEDFESQKRAGFHAVRERLKDERRRLNDEAYLDKAMKKMYDKKNK